jgi:hypothetical protein
MARAPSTFKQRDLTRAIRAVQAAGVVGARVEVGKDGKIVVVLGEAEVETSNPWDQATEELSKR